MWSLREALILAVITVLIVYYLKYLWRRRYLYIHSMKVPGPLSLPIIGSLCMLCKYDDLLKTIIHNFETYPGVFRIWQGTELSYYLSDAKYVEIVLQHGQCLNKGRLSEDARPVFGGGLFTARVDRWKRHIKLIGPTFHPKILSSFVDVFVEKSNGMITHLDKYVKLGREFPYAIVYKAASDMICATAMGVADVDQCSTHEFGVAVENLLRIVIPKLFIVPYRLQWIFNNRLHSDVESYHEKIQGFAEKLIQKKTMQSKSVIKGSQISNTEIDDELQVKVFLDYLHKINKNESEKLTDEELRDEVNTFFIAGSHTTSTTACFVMTMLGLHQDVQQKVFDEVMSVCGPHRNIDNDDLRRLEYTEMAIKETMRLFNAVPYIVREANEDIKLDKDVVIPKGSQILVGIIRIHNSPQYWPNPKKFIPERFLPEEVVKRPPYTFIPFAAGARSCLGRQYAMMALKTIIVTVIRKYCIFTGYKSIEEIELKYNLTISAKDGYKLTFQHRNV